MQITKTDKTSDGKLGDLRAKAPGAPTISMNEQGKLGVQVAIWVPDGSGSAVQHEVGLTDGDIERLLDCLSNPKSPEEARAVGKLMQANLRNLLRLSALGSGVSLVD